VPGGRVSDASIVSKMGLTVTGVVAKASMGKKTVAVMPSLTSPRKAKV
jgi:hypothetical protein